jgi:hypothetical protein
LPKTGMWIYLSGIPIFNTIGTNRKDGINYNIILNEKDGV